MPLRYRHLDETDIYYEKAHALDIVSRTRENDVREKFVFSPNNVCETLVRYYPNISACILPEIN